jgi:hypothetical protein
VFGGQQFQQGTTVNISRTGVLFNTEPALAPDMILLARIFFPPELTGGCPSTVVCRATVVRTRGREAAAAISNCRFLNLTADCAERVPRFWTS